MIDIDHEIRLNTLVRTHAAVWQARAELAAGWLTPPQEDALFFAFEETGEVVDAWMRINRPQYNRNHTRIPDPAGEVADTAMMLCTALGPEVDPIPDVHWTGAGDKRALQELCRVVGAAQNDPSPERVRHQVWYALHICAALVPDLAEQVTRRLDHIRTRIAQEQRYE